MESNYNKFKIGPVLSYKHDINEQNRNTSFNLHRISFFLSHLFTPINVVTSPIIGFVSAISSKTIFTVF